jgi:acetyltransferase
MPGTAYWLIKNLRDFGYSGPIYPVNPDTTKYPEVLGLPVHESIAAVPEAIDLAVAIAPPSAMPEIVTQCAGKGVPAVIVLSEGFAESNAEGAELQRRITAIARETGVRIMGPNTFGAFNAANGLATIAPYLAQKRVESGGVAVCSQTGSTGPHQMPLGDWGYPIGKMCDIGNKCDVDEVDVMEYLADDPQTKVVALHLEDVRDGRRFMEAARRLVARKPLVILKTGRTRAGARASASHTGSLMGSDHVYDAAFRQVGAIRVATWRQLWEVPKVLLNNKLPQGKRFAVITITGGQGVIAADAAADAGLEVATFSPETIEKLLTISPKLGGNPIDLGPAMSDSRSQSSNNPFAIVGDAASVALEDPNVDCATVTFCVTQPLVALYPMLMDMFEEVARRTAKALNIWVYGTSLPAIEEAIRQLQARGIPAHADLDSAIQALGCAADYAAFKTRSAGQAPTAGAAESATPKDTIANARRAGRTFLTEVESKRLMEDAGLPVVESSLATTPAEAVGTSEEMGFPVVLKIASPDVIHKSDSGGVRIGLTNASQVESAYTEIIGAVKRAQPDAHIDGICVQKMAKPGVEVIMGMSRDPQFGPTMMFGLGGVFTEVIEDVAFRVAPLDRRSAAEMVREIKGLPLLQGYRGGVATDLAALEDILIKLSQLVATTPEIEELDLNPVIAHGDGAVVVDARVILTPPA